MAYTKNNWKSGDVVTSSKLNHMEDGIADAGGTLVIGGFSYDAENNLIGTADKTWQEIDNALAAGVRCVVVIATMGGHAQLPVNAASLFEGEYDIDVNGYNPTTTSADGYPSSADGGGGDIG